MPIYFWLLCWSVCLCCKKLISENKYLPGLVVIWICLKIKIWLKYQLWLLGLCDLCKRKQVEDKWTFFKQQLFSIDWCMLSGTLYYLLSLLLSNDSHHWNTDTQIVSTQLVDTTLVVGPCFEQHLCVIMILYYSKLLYNFYYLFIIDTSNYICCIATTSPE